MTDFSRKTKIRFVVIVICALLIIASIMMPWQTMLETQIKNTFEARGLKDVELTLATESQGGVSFKNVRLGAPVPFSIENLTLLYSPLDLLNGKAGTWQIKNLVIKNGDVPLPPLNGGGTVFAQTDHLELQGQFESQDHATQLQFSAHYSFTDPNKREVRILSAMMPWNGGTVTTKEVKILLEGSHDLMLKLRLQRVSADTLLQQLTSKKASATGVISGIIPVTIEKEGTISIHGGSLLAQEPGSVTLSPNVIPGDNPQVSFVREVMKDFHYSLFSIHLDSDKNNGLSALMTLHGNNPAVLSGRSIELNIHLTGDVLDFVHQNLIWLSDPQKLLERGQNETN